MNPLWIATLRRHWPLAGAIGLFLVFTLIHTSLFQPAAHRYQKALKRAREMGLVLDASQSPAMIPPRLFALVADNALPSAEAQERGGSGMLTAELLEDFSHLLAAQGLEVIVTEPGPVTQQDRAAQVRAYLKVKGRYGQFVAMIDSLARNRKLMAIDRFNLSNRGPGQETIELWVSRYVLKQDRRRAR